MAKQLFEINPRLDRQALARDFAPHRRVQIRDVLTRETAEEIRTILAQHTPWGLAMQAEGSGTSGPQQVLGPELQTPQGQQKAQALVKDTHEAAARGDYAFRYLRYSLVEGMLEKRNPGGPHDLLLEYLNTPDFVGLVTEVTGIEGLVKADGHATCFAQQHFLSHHIDAQVPEGWRVAYVMNFTIDDWSPDWGGYLQFFDDEGDVVQAFRPRFNSLNLFAVPQPHAVSFVPPFAPPGRFAITGWLRDK